MLGFRVEWDQNCQVCDIVHQGHGENTDDQSEEGHVILLAYAVVEPLTMVVKPIYTSIADTTVLRLLRNMSVTYSTDQGIGRKVKAH